MKILYKAKAEHFLLLANFLLLAILSVFIIECGLEPQDPPCAPGCFDQLLGDGNCDEACNVSECNYDYGDCDTPTTTTTDDCAMEGENYSSVYSEYPEHCCEGLTEWESGFDTRISIGDTCYETGLLAGIPIGTCINCGNEICEDIENVCNCEEECTGGLNSDYATVDEFCTGDEWINSLSALCKEWLKVGDYPICYLCE